MREEIINLLMKSGKTGIEELITHMDQEGFFDAPCSGDHHLAKEGGLAEHSMNVYRLMCELDATFKAGLDEGSMIICGLLHDLGRWETITSRIMCRTSSKQRGNRATRSHS